MNTPEQPLIPSCAICKQDLGEIELNNNRTWHYTCQNCSICGKAITIELIEKSLAKGEPVAHPVCKNAQAIVHVKQKTIPITIDMLDAFNNEILILQHDMSPSVDDVVSLAACVTKLTEVAANASWLLKAERAKIDIKNRDEYTEKVRTERKAKAKASEEKAIEEKAKAEKQAQLKAERENPMLRLKRKAIEQLMTTLNISYEAAEAMLGQSGTKQ